MATRSEIWRTFWIRVPAATTGAERSASNTRAMTRLGAARRRVRTSDGGSSGPAAGSLDGTRRRRGAVAFETSGAAAAVADAGIGRLGLGRLPGRRGVTGDTGGRPAVAAASDGVAAGPSVVRGAASDRSRADPHSPSVGSAADSCNCARISGPSGVNRPTLTTDDQDRLRLPRPGQPVRRHGPPPRRELARGRCRLRRRRRRAGRADHAARLGGSRGGPQPDRERAAGAARGVHRLPRSRPRPVGGARGRHPGARVRGRPLDGPVHGPRRRRCPRPGRRHPARPHPRPAHAGVRDRARGSHGRPDRPRRREAPGARRAGIGPRDLRGREPQLAGPGRDVRRAGGRGGVARRSRRSSARSGRSSCRSASRPTPR